MAFIKAKLQSHFKECAREIKTGGFWRDVVCEVVATFFLISVQCSVALSWGRTEVRGGNLLGNLAMACVVIILVEIFGTLGGAHMNPAVSIAFVIAGNLTVLKALIYTVVQCIGAVLGAAFTFWLTPGEFRGTLAVTAVRPGVSVGQGLLTEMWVTSLLILTIHGSTNAGRRPVFMHPIIIGMAVMVGGTAGGEYSGASMNPARSFGPALVMNAWENQWIYWFGPIMGASIATVLYLYVFDRIDHPADRETEVKDNNFKLSKEANGSKNGPVRTVAEGVSNSGFVPCDVKDPGGGGGYMREMASPVSSQDLAVSL